MSDPPEQERQRLEEALGYWFDDPSRLEAALTHRSYRFERREACEDNQRLEFLGDAVLGFLLADWVYQCYEEHPEGMLTILRSRVVSTSALASVSRSIGLGGFLRLGRGEDSAGGRDRDTMLADALEAVFAAIFLDGGLEQVAAVFRKVFSPALASLDGDAWAGNPKGRLQQIAQRDHRADPVYLALDEEGPAHARVFRAAVCVGTAWRAEGIGNSKQAAQVAAAQALLETLEALQDNPASRLVKKKGSEPLDRDGTVNV